MFASKQFFVDEQNTYFELFTTNRKKIQTGSVKKIKNFEQEKKRKSRESLFFYTRPGKFNDLFMVSR
jgi:hypothetical protein